MYLPFSERRKRWELLDEAAHKCLGCEKPYGLCAVVHLLTPDENGQVHGSLETSMGVFVEHPNKRWEFVCPPRVRSVGVLSPYSLISYRKMHI